MYDKKPEAELFTEIDAAATAARLLFWHKKSYVFPNFSYAKPCIESPNA